MFFFMYVLKIYELVDALSIRRYNTLLTSFATFVRKNLYKTIKLPGFSKNSYLKKRVYSVHFDTGRKLIRCRCRIRCWGQKQGNSCYLVLIRNHSILRSFHCDSVTRGSTCVDLPLGVCPSYPSYSFAIDPRYFPHSMYNTPFIAPFWGIKSPSPHAIA